MLLRVNVVPFLGHKRPNAITSEDVQRFGRSLVVKAPKTVNSALTVLSVALKKAVEWATSISPGVNCASSDPTGTVRAPRGGPPAPCGYGGQPSHG